MYSDFTVSIALCFIFFASHVVYLVTDGVLQVPKKNVIRMAYFDAPTHGRMVGHYSCGCVCHVVR